MNRNPSSGGASPLGWFLMLGLFLAVGLAGGGLGAYFLQRITRTDLVGQWSDLTDRLSKKITGLDHQITTERQECDERERAWCAERERDRRESERKYQALQRKVEYHQRHALELAGDVQVLTVSLQHALGGSGAVGRNFIEGYVVADDRGIILSANTGVTLLLHWTPEELIGKPVLTLIPARFRTDHEASLKRVIDSGVSPSGDHVVHGYALDRDGQEVPVDVVPSAFRAEGRWRFGAAMRRRHELPPPAPSSDEVPATGQVFLSYATADRPLALEVREYLESRGIPVWIDRRSLVAGENWAQGLLEAVDRAAALVLIMTDKSLRSTHCGLEVNQAATRGVPIVPFRIGDMPKAGPLAYLLSLTQHVDASEGRPRDHFDELAGALRRVMERASMGSGLRVSPFPGNLT